jgi:hypothetical protein
MGGDHNVIAGASMADHFNFSATKLQNIHAIEMGGLGQPLLDQGGNLQIILNKENSHFFSPWP